MEIDNDFSIISNKRSIKEVKEISVNIFVTAVYSIKKQVYNKDNTILDTSTE